MTAGSGVENRASNSDHLISVKQLSATEAARRFSDVLDNVESERETFVVGRHGRAVATTGLALAGTGRALKDALDALRENRPDVSWAAELRELREGVGPGTDPWHD